MGIRDRAVEALAKASGTTGGGAGPLPPQPPPKVKPKQATIPSSFPNATPSDTAAMIKRELNLASADILQLRFGASTLDTIRDLATASPDLSAAVAAAIRMGLSEGFRMKAWNPDGTFNPDGTRLAYQILQRMDQVPDYTEGYNSVNSILSLSEQLAKDLMYTGGMGMELVLDKGRLPQKFVPIAGAQLVWYPDSSGKTTVPKQLLGGVYTDLDIPTFFYVSLDQDLRTAYSQSPLEASIQPVLADSDFTNDMRRVIKRAVHPRLDITIDTEVLQATVPPEIVNDPQKLLAFRSQVQADVSAVINGLLPEDALVHYDFLTVSYVTSEGAGNSSPDKVFEGVQKLLNAKLATGARTLPSVLGHGSGSQNIASSETLLAMKTADGMIRRKLNEMLSKGFTLAVRLFGLDVAISFIYDPIELRPTSELEAFYAQRQSRILEQLSFGLITDEEACLDLTGSLPPPGMAKLSGTMFSAGLGKGGENPYSNAPAGGGSGSGKPATTNGANDSNAPTGTRGKK